MVKIIITGTARHPPGAKLWSALLKWDKNLAWRGPVLPGSTLDYHNQTLGE